MDEAKVFRHGDEGGGADPAMLRILPASQDFHSGAAAGSCVHNGLEPGLDESLVDGFGETVLDVKVGSVILATGYDLMDPTPMKQFGYGKYSNVMTSLEFERLNNATGPTSGRILMRDGSGRFTRPPESVGIIHCVGSRDENYHEYCSRVCCMYAIKNAQIIKEHEPETEIAVYYNDIRAFGKGFEELYHRVREEFGVEFIRGRPAKLSEDPETKRIMIRAEETLLAKITEREFDLVVLSVGLLPSEGSKRIGKILSLPLSADGFFAEAHPKLRPVETAVDGVFLAGCAQAPKDIPDSVAQARAAAGRWRSG